QVTVKIVNNAGTSGSTALTVVGTIDGDTNILMYTKNLSRTFVYDGTGWKATQKSGQEAIVWTTSTTWTVTKTAWYMVETVGAGAGGGGGGAAALTGGVSAQTGGGAGGAG